MYVTKKFKHIASSILILSGLLIFISAGAKDVQANSIYLSTNASCFPPNFKIDLTALKNGTPESNLPVTFNIKINGKVYNRSGKTNSQGKWSYTWDITEPGTAKITYSVSSSAPGVSGSTNLSMTCSGPIAEPTPTPEPTEPPEATPTPETPTGDNPVPEPDVSCPASHTQIGSTILEKSIDDNSHYSGTINVPKDGELLLTGQVMEGHPDVGCTPSGGGSHKFCKQDQKQESLNFFVDGTLIGTYDDKNDPGKLHYWYSFGQFTKDVSAGNALVEVKHKYDLGQSASAKFAICLKENEAEETPTPEVTATPEPTPTATPTEGPTSCNNYQITGIANDPDQPGSPVTVTIVIRDALGRPYSYPVSSSGGNFIFNIPDEFKDDYLHTVTVSANNPYTKQVYISTGTDAFGNPTGYWTTVNNPSYAYADYSGFRCEPPSTDLTTTGKAWAKKPGRTGSYPNGDVATEIIWLEDAAQFEVIVENLDPILPALQPEFTINLPVDPDGYLDWDIETDPNWVCNTSGSQITCRIDRFESFHTKIKYGSGETKYTLITAESLVPGYYLPEFMEWDGSINSETIDRSLANNDTLFDLEVIKTWLQTVSHTELISQYNHVTYHESITDQLVSKAPERSFEADEMISSIFQVPVYSAPAISLSAYPTLTVKFCVEYDEPNCTNDSAIIEGAIRLNSYELESTRRQIEGGSQFVDDPSVPDLQTGPINFDYGLTNDGRFVDEDETNCQVWQDRMNLVGETSDCSGKYEVYSTFPSASQAPYEWSSSEMFGLLLSSSGGRAVSCGSASDECITSASAKPGIYKTTGTIDYEVIFFDPDFQRLGPDPNTYPYIMDFEVFIQQVASFQEMER